MIKNCRSCGVEFNAKQKKILFHSRECYDVFRKKEASLNEGKGKIDRICLFCGKEFKTQPNRIKSGRGKYCSKKCFYESARGRKRSLEFKQKRSKTFLGSGNPCWRGGKIERKCEICGESFLIFPGSKQKYCSNKCRFNAPVSEESMLKLSIANKGKKHSYEWKQKRSFESRGSKNPSWQGGLSPIKTMVRASFYGNQWRQKVFIRDDFTCQDCKRKGGKLHAHHKKSFSSLVREAKENLPLFDLYTACIQYSPLWDISNGVTLCLPCHGKIHKNLIKKESGIITPGRVIDITDRKK